MEIVKGSIAIMGSGETSPALVSVHRKFVEMLDNQVKAFLIDTPFGFQENADVLVDKLQLFFKKSVQIEIKLASLRNTSNIDSVEYFEMLEQLKSSNFIFSGPGSPSYASKTWLHSVIPNVLTNHLKDGKHAVFSSAAASTMGEKTIPVYEIYKVGMNPFWEEGLNILELYGLSCTVVPHFNNKEGGNHDTSCSYIGKNRLNSLIDKEYTNILGIDEHTALVINGEKEIFRIEGIGSVTVKTRNGQTIFEAGNEYSLSELQSILQETNKKVLEPKKTSSDNIDVNSLKKEIAKLNLEIKNNNDFTALFDKTILEIINLRNKFRTEKKYSESDEIRDLLDNLDITIEDNKTDSSWKFKGQ
ncbi:hypothetical protein N9A50_02065 [Acidimicrobiaceae bacterium]|nr:hypothetical protein [Acidimicrobiaceae bacterium]